VEGRYIDLCDDPQRSSEGEEMAVVTPPPADAVEPDAALGIPETLVVADKVSNRAAAVVINVTDAAIWEDVGSFEELYTCACGKESPEDNPLYGAISRVLAGVPGNFTVLEWMTSSIAKKSVLAWLQRERANDAVTTHFEKDEEVYGKWGIRASSVTSKDGLREFVKSEDCPVAGLAVLMDCSRSFDTHEDAFEAYGKALDLYGLVKKGSDKAIFIERWISDCTMGIFEGLFRGQGRLEQQIRIAALHFKGVPKEFEEARSKIFTAFEKAVNDLKKIAAQQGEEAKFGFIENIRRMYNEELDQKICKFFEGLVLEIVTAECKRLWDAHEGEYRTAAYLKLLGKLDELSQGTFYRAREHLLSQYTDACKALADLEKDFSWEDDRDES